MSCVALTTLKQALSIHHTAQDAWLQVLIDGVESEVELYLGYTLTSAARTESVDGGDYALRPSFRPVTSVTSVTDSVSGDVYSSGDYSLHDDAIWRDDLVRWAVGPPGRWALAYVGGWATVPARVVAAIYDLVYRSYHAPGGQLGQSAAGYSVSWAGADNDIARRIARYRHGSEILG